MKKVIGIVLVLMLLVALTACGPAEEPIFEEPPQEPTEEPTEELIVKDTLATPEPNFVGTNAKYLKKYDAELVEASRTFLSSNKKFRDNIDHMLSEDIPQAAGLLGEEAALWVEDQIKIFPEAETVLGNKFRDMVIRRMLKAALAYSYLPLHDGDEYTANMELYAEKLDDEYKWLAEEFNEGN